MKNISKQILYIFGFAIVFYINLFLFNLRSSSKACVNNELKLLNTYIFQQKIYFEKLFQNFSSYVTHPPMHFKKFINYLPQEDPKTVLVLGHNQVDSYLNHVISMFKYYGYKISYDSNMNWDILWHHDYPFTDSTINFSLISNNFKMINHFPGSGFLTNKISLVQYDEKATQAYIPVAFTFPNQVDLFKKYIHNTRQSPYSTSQTSNLFWVLKNRDHRGIKLINHVQILQMHIEPHVKNALQENNAIVKENDEPSQFIQQFVHPPLLIDGHKFDIGIYVVITSLDPLVAYMFNGDILFRFCPLPYNLSFFNSMETVDFEKLDPDSYVIGDDYLPLWEVPSLKPYFVEEKMTFKQAFDTFIQSDSRIQDKILRKGYTNVQSAIWDRLKAIIISVLLEKRTAMLNGSQPWFEYLPTVKFFEMVRFDFVIDSGLNPFLMEVNMSPNLSSDHFPPNKRLYLRLLYNVLSLILGVKSKPSLTLTDSSVSESTNFDDYRTLNILSHDVCINVCSGGNITHLSAKLDRNWKYQTTNVAKNIIISCAISCPFASFKPKYNDSFKAFNITDSEIKSYQAQGLEMFYAVEQEGLSKREFIRLTPNSLTKENLIEKRSLIKKYTNLKKLIFYESQNLFEPHNNKITLKDAILKLWLLKKCITDYNNNSDWC